MTPTEISSGDVFADIGFSPAEAEELTAKSTLILAMKDVIAGRALRQKEAAKVCGTDQPTLSKVLHGRMESVTIARLAAWLTNLDWQRNPPEGRKAHAGSAGLVRYF